MHCSPLISVVIVNYNYGRYLSDCIDSVLAQTYPNFEVIAVDDGSTDHSREILEAYRGRITIVQQNNQGVSCARNAGIRRSKGAWVAFLDADDLWMRDKLQAQSQWFEDPSVGMVSCGLEHIGESGSRLVSTPPASGDDLLPKLVTFTSPPIGGGSAVVARLEVLRTLGGFDESLATAADLDMWIRICAQWRIETVSAPLIKYRQHPESMSRDVDRFERENSRVLMKVFSDPVCTRVHHLQHQAFGRLYMIVAGSYFHEGNLASAARYAWKALLHRPWEIAFLLGFPLRVLRRLAAASCA